MTPIQNLEQQFGRALSFREERAARPPVYYIKSQFPSPKETPNRDHGPGLGFLLRLEFFRGSMAIAVASRENSGEFLKKMMNKIGKEEEASRENSGEFLLRI